MNFKHFRVFFSWALFQFGTSTFLKQCKINLRTFRPIFCGLCWPLAFAMSIFFHSHKRKYAYFLRLPIQNFLSPKIDLISICGFGLPKYRSKNISTRGGSHPSKKRCLKNLTSQIFQRS